MTCGPYSSLEQNKRILKEPVNYLLHSLARTTQLGFKTLAVTLLDEQRSNVSESKNPPGLSFHTMVR